MRIAGTSYTNSMASQINQLAGRQYKLQGQATSGQRITAPEDDPAGMAAALGLQADQSTTAQYADNISTLQSHSDLLASALQQLQGISKRVGDLAAESSDTLSTSTEMQANASETNQLMQQAVDIMNSKDGDQYIFGGTASGQPPFVATLDANKNVTGVTYQGNTNVADYDIGQSSSITVDAPGANTSGSGARGVITDSRYGADFFNHMISLRDHLLAGDTNSVSTVDRPALLKDEDNIITQVSSNGAASARLEIAATANTTHQSSLNTSLNTVAGADLTQTLTKLTQAQNAYQIALQSSASILQLRTSLLASIP